jgi:hypothetical protein
LSTRAAAATSSAGEVVPDRSRFGRDVVSYRLGQLASRECEPPVIEQPAVGQFGDEIGRIDEVCTGSDSGSQTFSIDTPIEQIGESKRHPLRLGEPCPVEASAK